MKRLILQIHLVFLLLNIAVAGANAQGNLLELAQCKKIISEINSMELTQFKSRGYNYYDRDGLLRKHISWYKGESEDNLQICFFDEGGYPVFLYYQAGNSVEDEAGYLYLNKGKIVLQYSEWNPYSDDYEDSEEEQPAAPEPDSTRLVKTEGEFSFTTPFFEMDLSCFSHVDSYQEYCNLNDIVEEMSSDAAGDSLIIAIGREIVQDNPDIGFIRSAFWEMSEQADYSSEEIMTTISSDSCFEIAGKKLIRYLGSSRTTDVVIPDSITAIGDKAFKYSNITSVVIPNSVNSMGSEAFMECHDLVSVSIPEGITNIRSSAFDGCFKLKYIRLPQSLKRIGNSVFSGCRELDSISIPHTVTLIGEYAFSHCANLQSFTFPDSVKILNYGVLNDCHNLKYVKIPPAATSIGEAAFAGCYSLPDISIPHSVKSIGQSAFYGCLSLAEIVLPAGLERLGMYAFSGVSFPSISFPDSLKDIDTEGIFTGSKIKTVKLSPSNKYFMMENGVLYSKDKTRLVRYFPTHRDTVFVIPPTVKRIDSFAFEGDSLLVSVKIPSSVTHIGACAFVQCERLREITIPNSVTELGQEVFEDCKSLESVHLPDSLETIASNMFRNCIMLRSVNIPSKTSKIDNYAFANCRSLHSLSFPESIEYISDLAFSGCPMFVKEIILSDKGKEEVSRYLNQPGNAYFLVLTARGERVFLFKKQVFLYLP